MEEADRAVVIGQVAEKRVRQREAAERLGVSVRQVKRLLARYRERGPGGLVSGHRGKASNNALGDGVQGLRRLGEGAARRPRAGRAVARRRRRGGPGGRREDGSPAGGPGQGGAAVAARLQAGAGPSLAAGVEAGRDGGRRRMRVWARFGLGLRSLRSLRPRPNRHHGRCSTRRRRRRGPVAKGDISTLR